MESYIDKAKMSLLRLDNKRRSECAFYDEALRQQMRFDAELENDVRSAMKDGDFRVYVQPKYDARTRVLAGGEALIRWQHKTKGFMTPDKFVPLFERNGFITEIDMYVYDKVCAMQRKLIDEGYTPVPISVNQSRLHLYRSDYIETLKTILNRYGLPAKYVELEITENIALSSGEVLEAAVKKIHSLGFTVSMDDFGSGESSLNILKDIDIDVLKLDRMFFLETENNTKARQIIKSVIDMANRLKISTVAEGVENEEQLRFLQDAGCDLIQGYLLGKPMPYEEFEVLFKKAREVK
jgi:EAL domain-containing protein (putative c-di-GMP-specific phosphodiesterase class I)